MPIYATVDGTTNSASVNDGFVNANEQYVTMFKLLTRAAIDGHVTRIAYNTGSAVSGATGTGTDYWDTGNSAGGNGWSVWRFNSSSYRDYEFYVMFSFANLGTNIGTELSQSFKIRGGVTYYSPIICQVAIAFDPTTGATTSPWNGTTNNDGTDTVVCFPNGTFPASSIWTTGSAGYSLKVFPEANNANNNELSASKGLFTIFGDGTSTSTNPIHYNMFVAAGTEADGILNIYKPNAAATTWDINALGVYVPRPELTSSILIPIFLEGVDELGSDLGTSISTTTHLSSACGIMLRTDRSESGDIALVDQNYWEKPSNVLWNTFLGGPPAQEIAPLGIQVNSSVGQGYVGTFGTDLMRIIAGTADSDLSTSENNIVLGANITTNAPKMLAPWSSSVGGGPGTHNHRTGSQF